jgi:anti-anti-sigma factor
MDEEDPMNAQEIISVQRSREALIFTPSRDIGAFADAQVEEEMLELLEQIGTSGVRHLVIDFEACPYFGSTMLRAMARFWRRLSEFGGRMALCNVTSEGAEVLRVTKLDTIWPICPSVREALVAVRG